MFKIHVIFFFNITTNNNYMCILVFIIDGGSGVALFRGKVYRTAGHCKSQLDYVQSATKIVITWPYSISFVIYLLILEKRWNAFTRSTNKLQVLKELPTEQS